MIHLQAALIAAASRGGFEVRVLEEAEQTFEEENRNLEGADQVTEVQDGSLVPCGQADIATTRELSVTELVVFRFLS